MRKACRSCSGDRNAKTRAVRRPGRSYRPEVMDDIEAGEVARDELDFIQRIEAYDGSDVGRFAEIIGAYLDEAPHGDQKRILDNVMRLHEAVANSAAWRRVEGDLEQLT